MANQSNSPLKPDDHAKQNRVLIIVIVILTAIILLLLFKPPLPAPPLPGPLSKPPLPVMPPGAEKVKTLKGVVIGYKANMHLDVNALQIRSDKAGIVTIDFRPHTAKTVMGVAGIGNTVLIQYNTAPNDETVGYQLKQIENEKTGITAQLDEMPPPPDLPDQAAEKFKLVNPAIITDGYGGMVAMQKDKLLYHFKPGLVDDILPLIKANNNFSLMAVRRNNYSGFVNINNNTVYIVLSITMDNKTFLVR